MPMLGRSLRSILLALVALLAIPAAAQVRVSAVPSHTQAAPGGRFAIAVVFDIEDHVHIWPNVPVVPEGLDDLTPIATAISLQSGPAHLYRDAIQWPPIVVVPFEPIPGTRIEIQSYVGRSIAFVPAAIPPDATPGPATITLLVSFQACNENQCFMPEDVELAIPLEILTAGAGAAGEADPAIFKDFDRSVLDTLAEPTPIDASSPGENSSPTPVAGGGANFFGITLPRPDGPAGIFLLILLSGVGGFLFNLTPCVLPVIPLKIMALSHHAKTPGRAIYLGVWMAAGVVAFWGAASLPLILFQLDPSRVFGIWWVTAGIGAIITIMAIGLMGFFQLTLPQAVYRINPKADSAKGSFLFGIMTAVLGLPCFGFIVGALLPATAGLPRAFILAIFLSIGAGMALPYLVLAAFPKLVSRIPRAGPAGDLVKQVMALLLLAAGAFFIGSGLVTLVAEEPYLARELHWWAAALLVVAAGLWLFARVFAITRKLAYRATFTIIALALGGLAIAYVVGRTRTAKESYLIRQAELQANPGTLSTATWIDYSPALFQEARQKGYVVMLDFTADWCFICQSLKASVLHPEPVHSALRQGDVVTMTVDCTSRKAEGWALLKELGQTGIPMLAIYTPGQDRPWLANAYTPDQVLAALVAARKAKTGS